MDLCVVEGMFSSLSTSSSHCSWRLQPSTCTQPPWPPWSQAGSSSHCFSLLNFSRLCHFACFCLYHGAMSAFLNALYPNVHCFWRCPWVNSSCSVPNKVSSLQQNWGVHHSWDLFPALAEHLYHHTRAGAEHVGSPFPEWHLPRQQREWQRWPHLLGLSSCRTLALQVSWLERSGN